MLIDDVPDESTYSTREAVDSVGDDMTDAETGRTRGVAACARWQPKITGDLAISWMIARIIMVFIDLYFIGID